MVCTFHGLRAVGATFILAAPSLHGELCTRTGSIRRVRVLSLHCVEPSATWRGRRRPQKTRPLEVWHVIEVENLTKKYGDRTAVNDINFAVKKGEVIGFLGPNGAGKSTTLRMLTGYLTPSAGRIRVGGVDAVKDPIAARRFIGYMPESVPLYREMRVEEYLRYRA